MASSHKLAEDTVQLSIGHRGYTLCVNNFNEHLMVHIRKFYQDKPTKFGIALTPKEWKILMNKTEKLNNLIEQMEDALKQGEKELQSESFPVGFRGFHTVITDFHGELYVHVRKFDGDGIPTAKGVALTVYEWKDLVNMREEVSDLIAEKKREVREKSQEPPTKKHCTENSNNCKRKLFKAKVN
jgi:hypothetical protein